MEYGRDLLSEHELRKLLSNAYAGMVQSRVNTRLLAESEPEDMEDGEMGGDPRTKNSMAAVREWLEEARLQCVDGRAFDDVVMGSLRRVARYLESVRNAGKPTTELEGWVFQRSKEWEDSYGERVALAMIVPELESCMSVRLPGGVAESVRTGYNRFGSVLPVPMTNRLHVKRNRIEPIRSSPALAEWNFLKVSFADRDKFSESVEMDGYCEIASIQSDARHHLGSPVVLAGTPTHVNESWVTIRGIAGNECVTAVRPLNEPRDRRLDDMLDTPARFLVAEWYRPGSPGRGGRLPELLWCEEGDRRDLLNDDIIGYVRLRGSVGTRALRDRYGEADMPAVGCLSRDGDSVRYAGAAAHGDAVAAGFLAAVRDIRQTWFGYRKSSGSPVTGDDLLSDERTRMARMVGLVNARPGMKSALTNILARFDDTGERTAKPGAADESGLRRCARSLVRMGLLDSRDDTLEVTGAGKNVLGLVLRDEMDRRLSGLDRVYIPDLESAIPKSTMLSHLKNGGQFEASEASWGRNRLLWVRRGAVPGDGVAEYDRRLAHHHDLVLELLRTTNHPANPKFVRDELGQGGDGPDFVSSGIILEQLGRRKKLVRSGDSWEYDMYWRVRDLLHGDMDGRWDMKRVTEGIRAPLWDRENVRGVLERMGREGVVVELSDGVWTLKRKGVDQARAHAVGVAKRAILSIVKLKVRGVDPDELSGFVRMDMIGKVGRELRAEGRRIVDEAAKELEDSNAIQKRDGMYYMAEEQRSGDE